MGAFTGLMPAGTLNVALSNFAKEFRNNALVGDILAPRVPVDRQSFQYVVWNRDDQRLPGNTLRAPGARPITTRRSYSTAPYMAQSHALSAKIPHESEAYGIGLGFSTKQKASGQLISQINLDREVAIANLILNTTNFPNGVTLSSTSMWDAYPSTPDTGTDGSHPIKVVNAYKAILRQSGIQDSQMVLLLSDPVVVALQQHPDIINRFKYTNSGGDISMEQLSSVFRVKCVQASATVLDKNNVASWVWGANAVLAFAQSGTSQEDVSCAKSFTWTSAPDTTEGYGVIEFPDPYLDSKADWVSTDWYYDLRVTATETAIPILNAVAAPTMATIAADVEG